MRAADLLTLRPALDRFIEAFDHCSRTRPTRQHFRTYIAGQLSDLERKSVEPIALDAGVYPRSLQKFLAEFPWDEDAMRDTLQRRVQHSHGRCEAIGVIDETSVVKRGPKTPGVKRQYCGVRGKTDNCAVTVHLGVAHGTFHCLVDADLYLPEDWATDADRRREAHIPDSVVYRPKWRIGLDLLDRAAGNGLGLGWIVADEGYGGRPDFLRGLMDRGYHYVLEIPKNTRGWEGCIEERANPETASTRDRRLDTVRRVRRPRKARRVDEIYQRADGQHHSMAYHVKDTDKGPEVWRVWAKPFQPCWEKKRGPRHWLLVLQHPLTNEVKYFLSNAPAETPISTLVRVAFERWHIERCFEDDKGEIGLDHFEVRNYRSLKRHLILSMVSLLFLAEETQQLRGEKPRVDRLPGKASGRGAAGARSAPVASPQEVG